MRHAVLSKSLTTLIAVGASLVAAPALAQFEPNLPERTLPRLVTVTGDADVKVMPNEVILTLGLETSDNDLAKAKTLNNDRIKGVMAIAKAFNVDPKNVQVEFIEIQPRYRSTNVTTYTVRRTLVMTIRNIANFEALLTRLVQNNRANYVHGIQFRTSELRKHRDQARALAIKAAREKAVALSGALGHSIGRPYSIREDYSGWWSRYNSWWGGSYGGYGANAQVSYNSGNSGSSGVTDSTAAPGQITINARVTVSFELQ